MLNLKNVYLSNMKKYYIISVLFWVAFMLGVLNLGDKMTTNWNKQNFPYLLEDNYSSVLDITIKFFEIDLKKDVFNYCCDVINYIGNLLGFSYTQMNLIIFVIGVPLFILNLIVVLIFQFLEIKKLHSSLIR